MFDDADFHYRLKSILILKTNGGTFVSPLDSNRISRKPEIETEIVKDQASPFLVNPLYDDVDYVCNQPEIDEGR
jgi:hypothetical protein